MNIKIEQSDSVDMEFKHNLILEVRNKYYEQ